MPADNVEILRRSFQLANEGDLEAVVDLYAEDALLYAPDGWPEPGPWQGRQPILEQLRYHWDHGGAVEAAGLEPR
jgi:ketosteroid isomerase-like protein